MGKVLLWLLCGGATIALVVFLIIMLINKSRKTGETVPREEEEADIIIEPPETNEAAAKEFAKKAKAFIGLYALMDMIKEQTLNHGGNVFDDWGARIEHMDDSPALQKYWKENFADFEGLNKAGLAEKAGKLLDFVKEAGIKRSEETNVVMDREVLMYYNTKDGIRIEMGNEAVVDSPYWSLEGVTLEKGQISEKTESEEQ